MLRDVEHGNSSGFFEAEDGIRDYKVTGVSAFFFFFSSRRRHTRLQGDWSFRRVLFRSVRRLVPAVRLQGALDAAGTLTGRLADAQFSGTLRHRPRDLPPSVIRGVVRLDSRSDTLAVFADVVADSLSFDGLRGSFPGGGLPLAGAVTGPVRLDGTLAALATHADLQSTQDGGGVQVDGVLTLLASRLGARDATVRTRELDLSRWLAAPAAPSSRLSGTLAGTVGAGSGPAPAGPPAP